MILRIHFLQLIYFLNNETLPFSLRLIELDVKQNKTPLYMLSDN